MHPSAEAAGHRKVDTKWEKKDRAGVLKYRLVGREFNWLEERDDVFAAGSSALLNRIVDFNALKDDEDPTDPMVEFIGDEVEIGAGTKVGSHVVITGNV